MIGTEDFMFNKTGFGTYIDIARRELSVLKYREEVIANNVANAETPNFKRSAVNFETQLKEALDSKNTTSQFQAAKTHSAHIDFEQPLDYRTVKPRRFLDWQSQTNNNGNNVDMEQEMMDSHKTEMSYKLITRTMNDYYKRINTVLR